MTKTSYMVDEDRSDIRETSASLGFKDAKGRDIGYMIETYYATWTAKEAWHGCFGRLEMAKERADQHNARPRFALKVQATRNGLRYGASQQVRYFPNSALRDAAIIAYVADAKKRAARKTK